MKTVRIGESIHLVTYACGANTLCNKEIPKSASIIEKRFLWEATCAKCKGLISAASVLRSKMLTLPS